MTKYFLGLLALAFTLLLLSEPAPAHPEDEFCTADSGLDPALCAALAEADKAVDPQTTAETGGMKSHRAMVCNQIMATDAVVLVSNTYGKPIAAKAVASMTWWRYKDRHEYPVVIGIDMRSL